MQKYKIEDFEEVGEDEDFVYSVSKGFVNLTATLLKNILMNRLVLIGNGYDLAAKLPTSYENFLVEYLKNALFKCLESSNNSYSDEILTIHINNPQKEITNNQNKVINTFKVDLNKDFVRKTITKITGIDQLLEDDRMYCFKKKVQKSNKDSIFEIDINSKLFQDLLGDYNWKDIESFYFERVVAIYEMETYEIERKHFQGDKLLEKRKEIRKKYLVPLNKEFEQLKFKIIQYLCGIECKKTEPFKFIRKIKDPLNEITFNRFFNKGNCQGRTENRIANLKIANFNYTCALENSFAWSTLKEICSPSDIFYIHGFTDNPDDIIFGYGDDTHPIYKELELTGEDEYLRYLKSFHYPLSHEYISLVDFIAHDQFEVIIAGHSLGISDRILLKSIFEHDNCKCIRFLHQGRSDEKQRMQNRYMALSRHFDNKMIMRNKIVPFDMADKLH